MGSMIELGIGNGLASLTLNRSPVNAFNGELLNELDEALGRIEACEDVAVLHLKSALTVFCAGADLALMKQLLPSPAGRDTMIDLIRQLQRIAFRLEKLPVVTVAEIGGAALGGGLELALACDLRVAADDAKLGLPEASLGLLPGSGGTQRLPRLVGEAVARRLILGAEIIDGAEAARLGLVQWAKPSTELSAWTRGLIEWLGSLPAPALASCKRCIAAARDDTVDGYELELAETRRLHDFVETQERIHAFLATSK